jgi:hypothetical protein
LTWQFEFDLTPLHTEVIFTESGQKSKKAQPNTHMGLFAHIPFKKTNENDMAGHGICFDFYYCPKHRQTGQNVC